MNAAFFLLIPDEVPTIFDLFFFFSNGKKLDLHAAALIVLLLRTAAPIVVVSGWLTVTDSARSGIENGNFFFKEFEIEVASLGHKEISAE